MKTGRVVALVPFAAAILGGVYFGLFSCGGYVWHETLYNLAFLLVLIACLLCRCRSLSTTRSGKEVLASLIIWVVLIFTSYYISEAAAASFYPSPPTSFSDFLRQFLMALKYGPC